MCGHNRIEALRETSRLLEFYRQACEAGTAKPSEAGRLEFLSLAERARAHGRRSGALFAWLLRERKSEFITQADEDEAARRLREHLAGPSVRCEIEYESGGGVETHMHPSPPTELTEDERFVAACLRVAKQHRIEDPALVAMQGRKWSRERWESAHEQFQSAQFARWSRAFGLPAA